MKLFLRGRGSEIVWPRWIIHSLSSSIFLEISWLYFSLEPNSIPFSLHTSFSLYVICWWTTRREKIWGNRKPYSRRLWAWRVWTRGGHRQLEPHVVVRVSGGRRPESHFHSQTSPCQHLGSTEGFRKKVMWVDWISRCTKKTFLRDYLDWWVYISNDQTAISHSLADPSTSDLKSEEKQQYVSFSPKCPFLDFENVKE